MKSSKLGFVALLIIVSLCINVQSARIMDASSDCEFKGPCHKKEDCYDSCGVNKPPFNNAICVPGRDSFQCCCILS
ncbi:putative defensin-like protein 271 [Arabidopsis thaliana]